MIHGMKSMLPDVALDITNPYKVGVGPLVGVIPVTMLLGLYSIKSRSKYLT